MKNEFAEFRKRYRSNPAWYWLLFTVFSFFLLPEYVAPFVLFTAFIIFKRQWKKEGRLAKVGNIGKLEMVFMTYMLISAIWSKTRLDTLGCAGLWWAVILIQVMIYNLARTKEKIDKVIKALVASAAINGIVGAAQMISYILLINKKITENQIIVTPVYRYLDKAVYKALPFKIVTNMWKQRASGFFSNPNLLATFMIVGFALGAYLLLTAETKKSRAAWFISLVCISAGMASTMTRAGCYLLLAQWLVLFIVFFKKGWKRLLLTLIPSAGTVVPSLLIRYGKLRISNQPYIYTDEALQSSAMHFQIWKSVLDYIFHHAGALLFGTGFGCEFTGAVLLTYGLDKPHSHNFVIEIWMELGLVGLITLFVIIIYAFGKLVEIDIKDNHTLMLTVTLFITFGSYLVFGLSDYIFNSPKQIIFFMILIGLIQAASYTFEKHEIQTTKDLIRIAKSDADNLIHQ